MTRPWFVAAILFMVAAQILRSHQHDAASWMLWDYAGRLCGLGVSAEIALWIAAILVVSIGLN